MDDAHERMLQRKRPHAPSVNEEEEEEEEAPHDPDDLSKRRKPPTQLHAFMYLRIALVGWIVVMMFAMRWFWVHEHVFPYLRETFGIEKDDVESTVLLCAFVVPFVALGMLGACTSSSIDAIWTWRSARIVRWMQSLRLGQLDVVDAIARTFFISLQANCLLGKLLIDARSGKLAKSGYIKCTAKALGMNGLLALVLLLLLMARQSFLHQLLHFSSERATRYHTWLGQYATIVFALHGTLYMINWIQTNRVQEVLMPCIDCSTKQSYRTFRNFSGVVAFTLLLIVAWASMERMRRSNFRRFASIHALNALFLVISCIHYYPAVMWIAPPLVVYVIYRAISSSTRGTTDVVSAQVLSGQLVQLEFRYLSSKAGFQPGQYVYMNVPAISAREWHPFSISSSPLRSRRSFRLDIKVQGPFTRALSALIERDRLSQVKIDGFYGSSIKPCAHLIFVAGGSGITPFVSMLEHLTLQSEILGLDSSKERDFPQSIHVIWSARDAALLTAHAPLMQSIAKNPIWTAKTWLHLTSDATPSSIVRITPTANHTAFTPLVSASPTAILSMASVMGVLLLCAVYFTPVSLSMWWIKRIGVFGALVIGVFMGAIAVVYCIKRSIQRHTCSQADEQELGCATAAVPSTQSVPKQMNIVSGRPDIASLLAEIHSSIRGLDGVHADVGLYVSGPPFMQNQVLQIASTLASPSLHCHRKSFEV